MVKRDLAACEASPWCCLGGTGFGGTLNERVTGPWMLALRLCERATRLGNIQQSGVPCQEAARGHLVNQSL